MIQKLHLCILRLHKRDHKKFRSDYFFVIYAYTVNDLYESAPKYSLPSCFRYTILGCGVQSSVHPGGCARLADQMSVKGIGTSRSPFCYSSSPGSQHAPHSFRPCHYPGSDIAVPRYFLRSNELLGEFLALYDPMKTPVLNVDTDSIGKKFSSCSKAVTVCFMRHNFKCSGRNNTFRGSNSSRLTLFLSTVNSACDQSHLL